MNMTQDAATQEKEITETVIDGITVRLSFSDSGSDEIPKLVKDMFSNTIGGFDNAFSGGGAVWYDEAGNMMSSPFGDQVSSFATNNPVYIMGTAIMIFGIVLLIAGVVLAIYLKKRSRDK